MVRSAGFLLVSTLLFQAAQAPASILLEIRVFDGAEEVSADTRVTVYRAGERTGPVAQLAARDGKALEVDLPAGIYDAQAIREREGRVVSIRWAERLVVMPYPDEDGRHLEVVNFRNGFGALQVRARAAAAPDVKVFHPGAHEKEAAAGIAGRGYALFVVPAGRYDVLTGSKERPAWHTNLDVPLDRTRLWIVP